VDTESAAAMLLGLKPSPSGLVAAVVPAWPDLPEAIKAGIVAMVKAVAKEGGETLTEIRHLCERCGSDTQAARRPPGRAATFHCPIHCP